MARSFKAGSPYTVQRSIRHAGAPGFHPRHTCSARQCGQWLAEAADSICIAPRLIWELPTCAARLDAGIQFQLHVRQTVLVNCPRQSPEAAGTRPFGATAKISRVRETSNGPGFHGSRKRNAGARASQAKIGLVRRQQRHKSNPKHCPENHSRAFSCWYARTMRDGLCDDLKSFAKFETNPRFIAASSY
jgi:hypothetical protein